ncbi:hypothetical protein [Roseomonas mucosa]|uniref:hypothetical protein n=1 Tax=Roseomonas mucosa TaxID=207340 RepID=UPI0028CCB613|nr:hypothetical protein [Roseomonas mucosa]MDT8350977.1 hypothetical protein [Roseomonas mucosa]
MADDLSTLAQRLIDCAASALAEQDGHPTTPSVLRHYVEDGQAAAAAVLQALLPLRRMRGEVVLELPDVGRITVDQLLIAVERIEVPNDRVTRRR